MEKKTAAKLAASFDFLKILDFFTVLKLIF